MHKTIKMYKEGTERLRTILPSIIYDHWK